MTQRTGISEAEDLSRMISVLCNGHDTAVIVMVLSKLLGDVLTQPIVTEGLSAAGARRWRKQLKRHYLQSIETALSGPGPEG